MIDDIETKGYGLPYLGIKPTAIGVVPITPVTPMPQMPIQQFQVPMPHVKVPASQNPSHVGSQMPLSQPQAPFVPQPLKTTQAPISNAQLSVPNPAQAKPPAPQIDGPLYPPLSRAAMPVIPMGGIQNGYHEDQSLQLPQSLQPQPAKLPQQKPVFNNLTNLLTRK